jgi:hypothetical protein
MSEAKTNRLTIKFSQKEYEELLQKASFSNMPLATYARERILFDVSQIQQQQSFEFKMLKGISYCVGSLLAFNQLKLSDPEKQIVSEEIMRVMKANGLDENLVVAKEQPRPTS